MTQDAKEPDGDAGGNGNGPIFIVPPTRTTTTLPYEAGLPDGWTEGLEMLRQRTRIEDGVVIDLVVGPCPRCGHQISKDVGVQSGIGLRARSDEIEIVCNCAHAHGQEKGVRGCGAQGPALLSKIPPETP